jgi:hypothetical protein
MAGLCTWWATSHAAERPARSPAQVRKAVSEDVQFALKWIASKRDNRGKPFAVVDKRHATIHVYDGRSRPVGSAGVLLGMARGDHGVPGVGDLPPALIPAAHRTTPAGRFVSEPGRNLDGEDVIWIDYDAGLAIHRVRSNAARDARLRRLASGVAEAQRVSAGCVVVTVEFYEKIIKPVLGRGRGVVYVLPEMSPVSEMLAPQDAANL